FIEKPVPILSNQTNSGTFSDLTAPMGSAGFRSIVQTPGRSARAVACRASVAISILGLQHYTLKNSLSRTKLTFGSQKSVNKNVRKSILQNAWCLLSVRFGRVFEKRSP